MANTLIHTIPEVAAILACSKTHVYALIDAGALHAIDIGTPGSPRSKKRVRHEDLVAFLDGRQGKGPAPKETNLVPGHTT